MVILSGIFPVKRFEPRPLFKIKIERVRTAGLGFIYCPDKESEREREREREREDNIQKFESTEIADIFGNCTAQLIGVQRAVDNSKGTTVGVSCFVHHLDSFGSVIHTEMRV